MMNFVFKMMKSVLKMMNSVIENDELPVGEQQRNQQGQ